MSNIKNVYIKAPKKTVNNKNSKMIIKKNSLKKIEEIQNKHSRINNQNNNEKINHKNEFDIKIIKKDNPQNNNPAISKNIKPFIGNFRNKNISENSKLNKKSFKEIHKKFNKNRSVSKPLNKKSFSRNKNNIKRLNIRKNNSKKKDRYVRLLIDSNIDVKNRMETKKKFQTKLMKLTKKQLRKVLIKKGLIKKHSRAPTKLLTDIYLNSKLLGDINVIQQN